jgi:hypothetical protein
MTPARFLSILAYSVVSMAILGHVFSYAWRCHKIYRQESQQFVALCRTLPAAELSPALR